MRVKTLTCLAVVLCCFAWSFAVETAYLPQVANGTSPGVLSVRTTFIVFNNSTIADNVTIHLTGNSGGAMSVTIPGFGKQSEFTFAIAPGETKILQTDGSGAIEAGAARVESSHKLGVSAIFTMYNGTGGFLTQAGVGSSPALRNFVIPVDASTGFNTGVALFAPSASSITFTLRRTDGTVVDTATASLVTRGHLAQFVSGTGGLFPNPANFTKGTLEASSTTAVAGVVLRQSTNLANTTLPVVDKTSTKTSFNLPQIANGGSLTGTNIRTTFIIFNISSSAANVTINVRKPDNTAFPVTVSDVELPDFSMAAADVSPEQSGTITRTLTPGASAFLQTNGTGDISAGTATVSSNVPIGVSAIYTLYNAQTFLTEAGVGDAPVSTEFTLPINLTAGSSNSVAFFNPNQTPVTIDAWLNDADGSFDTRIASPVVLPALSQTAKQIPELFPGKTNHQGTMGVHVTQGQGIAAVAILTNNDPLSYTTLPRVDGSFQGTLPSAGALLDTQETGVAATTNITKNAQLPGGFKISGTISGSFSTTSLAVKARSTASGGRVYVGFADTQTKKYVVVVPAGTYELSVCYLPDSMIPLGLPTLNYTVSPTFSVNADTTKNVTIPAVTLSPVTGSVTGDQLGSAAALLNLTSADWKTGLSAMVLPGLGATGQLPAGTYTASLALGLLPSGQISLGFYNIGTLTVSGSGGNGSFAVPAAVQVSGSVTGATANSFITVADTSVPNPTQSQTTCTAPSGGSMGSITGGAYQLLVPKNRPLSAYVFFPVGSGAVPAGSGMFPWPAFNFGTLSSDATHNFNIPALPALVTVSGKVTNGLGQGVVGVAVGAMSNDISGASGLYYMAGAETDTNGNYTMQVLQGINYSLTFTPPLPTP